MKSFLILVLICITLAFTVQEDFLADQKRYKRVRTAISEKENAVKEKLNAAGLSLENFHMMMVAYKSSDELQVYVKNKEESVYKKLVSYEICSKSGELGPKRKQGDYQVPEGFYHIDRFNPTSNFYLSLGINYPNLADRRKSNAPNLGGDIFIHGSCVTIGCLPMTTEKIKEIYLYAIHAKNNGQDRIPVYIFPFKMTDENLRIYSNRKNANSELVSFWNNLKKGYYKFSEEKKELDFSTDENGDYLF